MSQHKASLRKSFQKAISHKNLANKILDDVLGIQTQLNAALDKIDADDTGSMDTDYANLVVTASEYDAYYNAQNKADMRKILINRLSHKKLANEIIDSIEELQVAFNQLLAKIDNESGTLSSTNFVSTLSVDVIDVDAASSEAQHKAPFRKSLQKALSHKKLANELLDALAGAQTAFNNALAQLDIDAAGGTGALVGLYTPFKVTAISPDEA
jgi:predicted DNA-binding ribbon-helix-helix protein